MPSKSISLTEGPITKSIIFFSVPILLSNLFQQLYNSIDSAVVGSYAGDAALAAVGSTGSLINLLIGFFLGIATGAGILYAMHYGAGDFPGLKKLIDNALLLSIFAGAVISVVGIVLAEQMLLWMDTPADVLPLAKQYLQIYLGGTVITMVYNVGAGLIRAEGDSTRPLIYLIIGGVTNLILDLLFVAVFRMGVVGAAWATVLAQLVSAVLTVIHLCRLREDYRLRPMKMKLDKLSCWDITRISVPCGLQSSMFNISNLLVQAKINSFGSVAMAGVAAYSKIDGFIYMPMMALSLAVSTYVGQNIGAGQFARVKKGIRTCLFLAMGMGIAMGGTVILTCDSLLGLFTKDPGAKDFALQMMWYMAPFAWTFAFSDIYGGAMRGAGDAVKVTTITALCICVFRILWLSVLLHFIHDIRIVFLCYPISWLLSSSVMTAVFLKGPGVKRTIDHSET